MTTFSSGVGGSIGGPPTPQPDELAASAWTLVNKRALGIGHDSMEQSFVEMQPRYTFGYIGGFGYKTAAKSPLLDHPIETQRRGELQSLPSDNSWQAIYQSLISTLPPELYARFISDGNRPFDQRNLLFVSEDNAYRAAAQIAARTNQSSQSALPESLEATRTELNLFLPIAALKGALANSSEIIDAAQNFLTAQGPNYRYFDGVNNLLVQLKNPLNQLARVNAGLANAVDGQLTPETIALAAKAAQQFDAIKSQLERISLGPDLQMLLATISSLEIVSSALSLPDTKSAPLFITFALASIGLFSTDSQLGILGPSFKTVTDSLNEGLISGLVPLNSKGGNDFLAHAVPLSLAVFAGLSSLAMNSGLGIYPKRDASAINDARYFAFEIALQLVISSGFTETFYKELIAAAGGNTDAQLQGASILAQVAHLIIILAGATESKTPPAKLIEEEASYINRGIIAAAELKKTESDKATDKAADAAISLKLATLAMESRDYEMFLESINHTLESLGTSQNALKEDITQINTAAASIANLISMGNPDQQITRIETTI